MTDKTLKDKAMKIKGKDYVMVKDRIAFFNETYPNGSIITELISKPESEMIIVKATILPERSTSPGDNTIHMSRKFTGMSQAVIGGSGVNATAALENAETSAVGRALAMMGIGVIDSVASVDEMNKSTSNVMKFATEKQIKWIRDEARKLNDQLSEDSEVDEWVESILTVKPAQVPIFKVKDAIDKLKEKDHVYGTDTEGGDIVTPITDKDLEDLKQGKLPY